MSSRFHPRHRSPAVRQPDDGRAVRAFSRLQGRKHDATLVRMEIMRRVAALTLIASALGAQQQGAMQPTNGAPSPYHTVEGWAKLPAGRTWGSLSAVEIDRDGSSIWIAERCGANSCAGS